MHQHVASCMATAHRLWTSRWTSIDMRNDHNMGNREICHPHWTSRWSLKVEWYAEGYEDIRIDILWHGHGQHGKKTSPDTAIRARATIEMFNQFNAYFEWINPRRIFIRPCSVPMNCKIPHELNHVWSWFWLDQSPHIVYIETFFFFKTSLFWMVNFPCKLYVNCWWTSSISGLILIHGIGHLLCMITSPGQKNPGRWNVIRYWHMHICTSIHIYHIPSGYD